MARAGPADRGRERAQEGVRRVLEGLDGGRALRLPLLPAAGVRDPPDVRRLRGDPDLRRRLPVAQGGALELEVRKRAARGARYSEGSVTKGKRSSSS